MAAKFNGFGEDPLLEPDTPMNPAARLGAAACCALALAAPPAAAAPEPALRLSPLLTQPRAIGDDERSLLRVEWKSARTRSDETAAVNDMLARVQRMEGTVADVRRLVEAMPTEAAVAAPATPAAEADDLPWWAIGTGGAVLGLLAGWLAFRRRRPTPAQAEPVADLLTTPFAAEPVLTPEAMEESTVAMEAPAPQEEETPAELPAERTASSAPPPATPPEPAPHAGQVAPPAADQTMELANIMLSMGLAHGAAQTLEDHIRHHPRRALFHWLKLLDIYRRSGMQSQFEESAQDLRQHFNVHAFEWEPTADAAGQRSIEDYPHIVERVMELWPAPACADYLSRLLEDNRGGTRAGFPEPVAEEILMLLGVLGG